MRLRSGPRRQRIWDSSGSTQGRAPRPGPDLCDGHQGGRPPRRAQHSPADGEGRDLSVPEPRLDGSSDSGLRPEPGFPRSSSRRRLLGGFGRTRNPRCPWRPCRRYFLAGKGSARAALFGAFDDARCGLRAPCTSNRHGIGSMNVSGEVRSRIGCRHRLSSSRSTRHCRGVCSVLGEYSECQCEGNRSVDGEALGASDGGLGYYWIRMYKGKRAIPGAALHLIAIDDLGKVTDTGSRRPDEVSARTQAEAVHHHLATGIKQADDDLAKRRAELEDNPPPKPPPIDPASDKFFKDDDY